MDNNTKAATRKPGTPGRFSRWMQLKMNAWTNTRIRKGRGTFMDMDVLILHTTGRRSGQPRQSPVAWFPDGQDAWQIVATAQPRIAKYQAKSERQYPMTRLTLH